MSVQKNVSFNILIKLDLFHLYFVYIIVNKYGRINSSDGGQIWFNTGYYL